MCRQEHKARQTNQTNAMCNYTKGAVHEATVLDVRLQKAMAYICRI